jgi:hypothetical protein
MHSIVHKIIYLLLILTLYSKSSIYIYIKEHDELLAKALHESLNMNASQQMNPEQFNYLISQQLQQEEYER